MTKLIIEATSPSTQTVASVEQLARLTGKKIENGILDLGKVCLVKSSKDDCYYTVSEIECSCPARCFHPQVPCKHIEAFNAAKASSKPEQDDFYAKARRNSEIGKQTLRNSLQRMSPRLKEIAKAV